MTLLFDNQRDKELRALLVAHKDELTDRQITELILLWNRGSGTDWYGGTDFLPIIRMAALPPRNNVAALGLLAQMAPDEARPLILEEIHRAKSIYIQRKTDESDYIRALCALPDRELPEFDSFFQEKLLTSKDPDLFILMPLIARYATPQLLLDVLTVYRRAECRWACTIQTAVLKYWLRCNLHEGIEALARALKSREQTGCYHNALSEVLLDNWVDAAKPLVLEALHDPDPAVVRSAIDILKRHMPEELQHLGLVENATGKAYVPLKSKP